MKQMNKNPVITNTSMHANSLQWCLTLYNPIDYSPQIPLSMGFSSQEYWSGLPFSPPGDLPDPGIEPRSLTSPALAGGFFTTAATWEAHSWCSLWFNSFDSTITPGFSYATDKETEAERV